MILTLTLNPSVDISYPLDQFNLDTVNRVSQTSKTAGGKGLNVTRVLSEAKHEIVLQYYMKDNKLKSLKRVPRLNLRNQRNSSHIY